MFALDNMKHEDHFVLKGETSLNNNSTTNSIKIRQFGERLKLRHLTDIESVDILIRSSAAAIEMTRSDYLLSLREVYHDNLL